MKRISRQLCVLLTMLIVLSVPAAAEEINTPRSSNFFMSHSVYLYQTTSTQFQAWFEVSALYTMEKLGASEIKIQRSSDGENWTTMKTFSMDNYSNLICENTGAHASYVTYTGQTGYYYRAKVTLYAKNSSGFGEWIRYTDPILL